MAVAVPTTPDSFSMYKRCDKCRRVIKCDSELKRQSWNVHKCLCSLKAMASGKPPKIRKISIEKESSLPPFINGGIKDGNQLQRLVERNLDDYFICIIDNFIGEKEAKGVTNEIKALYKANGYFHNSGPGYDKDARSDFVYWLHDNEKTTKHINILKRSINILMTSLRFDNIAPIKNFTRFQASCFPQKSSGYDVHVDNPNNNGCLLSAVYYCNEDYNRKKHGGVHRFFLYDKKTVLDVSPKLNRLVIYWSDFRVAHGFCRCWQDMFSLSSWYFNDDDNDDENVSSGSQLS